MKMTVGLPRQLRSHEYPGLWEDFFRRLDSDVVFSAPTNKAIFDTGIKMCTGEFCLPMKVLHGHVLSLRDQVDAVFIPRFIYPSPREAACPKFCALPDVLRHNLLNVPIWEMSIDMKKGLNFTLSTLDELAGLLSRNVDEVRTAFLTALTRPEAPWYLRLLSENSGYCSGSTIDLSGEQSGEQSGEEPRPKVSVAASSRTGPAIGLIGHSYLVQDEFVTMNLHSKIVKRGYEVITSDDISYDLKRQISQPFQDRSFWGVGVDILGTALSLLNDESVKGLIYVTSFSCGIDSVVLELLERHTQKVQAQPRMRICLDEHTGESGLDTRLEAFFDLLERHSLSA